MARVLIIESAGNLWGSERALLDLIAGLPPGEVGVCCPPNTPLQAELERRGVNTYPYFLADLHLKPRWRRLEAAIGVIRACLAFRPDILHLNQSGSFKVTLPAATVLRLPVVAHIRIFEDAAYLAAQRNRKPLRGLIAISNAIQEEVARFESLADVPLHRIYDAYCPAPHPAAPPARVQGRIACVGRMVPIKGQDLLIDALALLKADRAVKECLMVGEGPADFTQALRRSADRHDLTSVLWRGFVHDVVPLLTSCTVLACPSRREPLGRVIFEAWDAGAVPVVFAGSGGAAEIVQASGGGLVYDSPTPAALAEALARAVRLDPAQAAGLVAEGRAWMMANCASPAYGKAVADVLSRTVKAQKG